MLYKCTTCFSLWKEYHSRYLPNRYIKRLMIIRLFIFFPLIVHIKAQKSTTPTLLLSVWRHQQCALKQWPNDNACGLYCFHDPKELKLAQNREGKCVCFLWVKLLLLLFSAQLNVLNSKRYTEGVDCVNLSQWSNNIWSCCWTISHYQNKLRKSCHISQNQYTISSAKQLS